MPKNTKGGKKHKQLKNDSSKIDLDKIVLKDNSGLQYYAIIEKNYGHNADVKFIKYICKTTGNVEEYKEGINDNNIDVLLCNSKAIIRGSIAKKCKLRIGDIVLISIREYDNKKVDLLYKYNEDEYKYLYQKKLIDHHFSNLISGVTSYEREGEIKDEKVINICRSNDYEDIVFDEIEENDNYEDNNYDNI